MKRLLVALVCLLPAVALVTAADSLDTMIDHDLSSLVATYKNLHAAPELSHREEGTSRLLAARLRAL
ncbi:MAG TPA: amidohydrolase, partial [Candidatus Polarisedimenticolia bacterium]|nr:amidohydrolase [Candidatus Polarisedimenticolia bacterium]